MKNDLKPIKNNFKIMKKLYTLTVLILACRFSFAQDSTEKLKSLRFGLKIAPSVYWSHPDNANEFASSGNKMKFSYGLVTDFKLNKVLAVLTGLEINYSSFGINYKNPTYYKTDTFNITKRNYKVTYVDLPLTLKMKTPEIGYITYFGQFGLTFSVRAKGKAIDSGTTKKDPANNLEITDVNVTKELNLFKLGLNVGGGIEYNLAGSTSLLIGINYHNGFTNILKKESAQLLNSTYANLKQNAALNYVSLSLGVLF